MTGEDVATRAARGAARMEAARPGSVARLDPARLDVQSTADCPIGQAWGDWCAGVKALFRERYPDFATRKMLRQDLVDHGLVADPARGDEYAGLNAAWRGLIERARGGAS